MKDNETPRAEVVSTNVPGFEAAFGRFLPPAQGMTMDQLEKQVRMANVFAHMRPNDVEVLYRRHIERMTLDAMAEELEVTRQAVLKQVSTAEQNFRKAFGEHWLDEVSDGR